MKMQIVKLMLKEGILNEEQLKEGLEKAKTRDTGLSEALFELGYISENELLDFLGKSFGVPVISIEEHSIEEEVLKLIPREIAIENRLMPLNITGSALTVAMSDPSNIIITDELSFLTEKNIIPVVVSERSIVNMLEQYYGYSGKQSKDSEKQAKALEEMLTELVKEDIGDEVQVDKNISMSGETEEVELSYEASNTADNNSEPEVPDIEQSDSIAKEDKQTDMSLSVDEDPYMFDEPVSADKGSLENTEEDEPETLAKSGEDQQSAYTLTSSELPSTLGFDKSPDDVSDTVNELHDQNSRAPELEAHSNNIDETILAAENTGQRVLVIDHSRTVQKLIALSLSRKGYSVSTVSDGMEALSRLHDVEPDLIFIEINLPHMDGYKVCKIIKSHGLMKRVPVVMMSGKEGLFDKMRSKMAGANGNISKPFTLNDIAESARGFTDATKESAASA